MSHGSSTGRRSTSAHGDRLTPVQDLMVGALAGGVSRVVVAPLDVVKIRFQVQHERGIERALGERVPPQPAALRGAAKSAASAASVQPPRYTSVWQALSRIAREEGVRALFKGNVPALAMVMPYASIQFATFYQFKQLANVLVDERRHAQRFLGPGLSLLGGGLSGVAATLCVYPLDLLRTRMAAQGEPRVYRNLRDAVSVIVREEGVRGFYAGLSPTLVEIVPYIALQFFFYETAKSEWLRVGRRGGVRGGGAGERRAADNLAAWESFVIGAATGTAAKMLTLPLDNAKKRMQVQGQLARTTTYRGVLHCCRAVFAREGARGLFRGAAASAVKAAPASGVTFFAYEGLKRRVLAANAEADASASSASRRARAL